MELLQKCPLTQRLDLFIFLLEAYRHEPLTSKTRFPELFYGKAYAKKPLPSRARFAWCSGGMLFTILVESF